MVMLLIHMVEKLVLKTVSAIITDSESSKTDITYHLGFPKNHIYVVPLDENGNDKLFDAAGNSLIYDSTMPCPSMCGVGNQLNGGA